MTTDSNEMASAIESGDCESVRRLLETRPGLIDGPGWTPPPLHCCVLWNQPEIAGLLLDVGADLEQLDSDRQTTPLRYAIVYCKHEMISLFVSRGANFGPLVEGGTTAMQLALDASRGSLEEFEELPSRADYGEVVELLNRLIDQ